MVAKGSNHSSLRTKSRKLAASVCNLCCRKDTIYSDGYLNTMLKKGEVPSKIQISLQAVNVFGKEDRKNKTFRFGGDKKISLLEI